MIGYRKLLIGLAVTAGLLALFLLTIDVRRMFDELAKANYVYVIPAIAVYLVSILFRAIRWHVLLRHIRPIDVRRLYPVVVVGYMANNLLPMRLGELVRSYHVGEREGISKTSALATILVERVFDALILLALIAGIAIFVPLSGVVEGLSDRLGLPWPLLLAALIVPFVGAFGFLTILAISPTRGRQIAAILTRLLPKRLEAPVSEMVDLFMVGLVPLRSPAMLGGLFLLSVPIWLAEAGLFVFIGWSFGLNEVFDTIPEMVIGLILVTAISNIGSSIPAAPGGIGLFEIVARETLVLLPLATVDRALAGGYAAVVHAVLLLSMILLGQIFLWTEHLSLRGLSRAGQARASEGDDDVPATGPLEGPEETA